ncbi:RNase adapter RapZ [Natronoglycomyces albus]|uniref:RNase adapter RapZ n=1 Tax=Natronoglycomyces albus TaxID=2811108 RepID=A0A895XN27_9ACTN|nr:RNase adapter RapZ [Natronoglycomyces albus]QSB03876.1 RNase adapter RapZ [Natronoglycomyces albus]
MSHSATTSESHGGGQTDRSHLDLVIVTGISGGGRSTVARALENIGYFVVDNLPEALVAQMAELASHDPATRRTAIVLDVRSHAFTIDLMGVIDQLREAGYKPHLVFVDADDDVIIRRYKKVRRSHPLQSDGLLADGIAAERAILAPARLAADTLIDTTHLNENQLRSRVENAFVDRSEAPVQILFMSFGFKYGIPLDADFVADVRFLPNPHWVPQLREHTGQHAEVSKYVLSQESAEPFLDTYQRLISATTEGFEREGKRHMTIAIGCTGGKHRSVAISEELATRFDTIGIPAHTHHRDLGRE